MAVSLRAKPLQPSGYSIYEPVSIQFVKPFASFFSNRDQPGVFQSAEMSSSGGPFARETLCDFPCRHSATAQFQNEQDLAAGRVCERAEYNFKIVKLLLGLGHWYVWIAVEPAGTP